MGRVHTFQRRVNKTPEEYRDDSFIILYSILISSMTRYLSHTDRLRIASTIPAELLLQKALCILYVSSDGPTVICIQRECSTRVRKNSGLRHMYF